MPGAEHITRRRLLGLLSSSGALWLSGCAANPLAALDPGSRTLLSSAGDLFKIMIRGAGVLRRQALPAPEGLDLRGVAARMERTMLAAKGVGIAGPQVGISLRVATLMLGYRTDEPRMVFTINPRIIQRSDETVEGYEGCLSIPDVGGLVRRNRWVRVRYATLDGREHELRSEGPDAVLWQHELDHLDGVLYTDRLLGKLLPMEEVRRLRKEQQGKTSRAWPTEGEYFTVGPGPTARAVS